MARRPAIPVDKGKITTAVVTDRAKMQCECTGCDHRGRCTARQSKSHPNRLGLLTQLMIVFLDYNPGNWQLTNLKAVCQPCRKAHEDAKPKPEALRPEFGGSLFAADPVKRRETPTL